MIIAYITSITGGPTLFPGGLLSWLFVGLIAGFLASAAIRGRGYGCIGNIIVGLVGAVIGGYLASLLDIQGTFTSGAALSSPSSEPVSWSQSCNYFPVVGAGHH